jgi:hypothetical protein
MKLFKIMNFDSINDLYNYKDSFITVGKRGSGYYIILNSFIKCFRKYLCPIEFTMKESIGNFVYCFLLYNKHLIYNIIFTSIERNCL